MIAPGQSLPASCPPFSSVDIAVCPRDEPKDIESPFVSSSNALARVEFEAGREKDGTKVLMVEWEDDETTQGVAGDWVVSWEGKRTVLPARDNDSGINRLYFLLLEGVRVPAIITLTLKASTAAQADQGPIVWQTNPLPAFFSPELGATARQAGKKGVLHTIWAKKRLEDLTLEIQREAERNAEGIALHMAVHERDWIERNFGVVTKPASISVLAGGPVMLGLTIPTSPRSPGGGKLMDKLKGLKLDTSERETGRGGGTVNDQPQQQAWNSLSPERSDVAFSSFSSFAASKDVPDMNTLSAIPPRPPGRRSVAHRPAESVLVQQDQSTNRSLQAVDDSHTGFSFASRDDDREDELFALPMSPRSPGIGRSPFSFCSEDTLRSARLERDLAQFGH